MVFTKNLLTLFSFASLMRSVLATAGNATWYNPGLGMCGMTNAPWQFVTALNPADYDNGENCGRIIQINYQGRTIRVEVVDMCITCGSGGMDLSQAAFRVLDGDLEKGVISMQWEYV